MTVLFDADSLVYSSCYGTENLEEAIDKFEATYNSVLTIIADYANFELIDDLKVIVYHGATGGNFRKDINPEYKANRKGKEKPPNYYELSAYVDFEYHAIGAVGEEVDDLIARDFVYHNLIGEKVCIVSIDKDYLQIPNALIYNYGWDNKKEDYKGFIFVSEEDARKNFWTQMITGDAADNVNYLKGKGKVYARKHLEGATSDFSYIRRVYTLFKETYGTDARNAFTECYNLLKIG